MKLTVQKNILGDTIQKLTSIIGSRTSLAILNNILLKAESDSLFMETTDLDIRITAKIPATVEKNGSTTVPGKKLLLFVKDFQSDKIVMESDESFNLKIESPESSYKLLGISPSEFPIPSDIVPIRKITIPHIDLYRHLSLVSYAAGNDESRKILNGILLSIKSNMLITAATDGKRLALLEKTLDKFDGSEGDVVFPSRTATEVQRIITKEGNAEIEIGEKMIKFNLNSMTLTSKILEGTFPNYRQVIPTSFSKKVEINKEIFQASLRRIANVISESNPVVAVTFANGTIALNANNTGIGEGMELIPVNYTGSEFKMIINPTHLLDPLKVMTVDKFICQMNDGYSPVSLLGDEGFIYVVMPVRNK